MTSTRFPKDFRRTCEGLPKDLPKDLTCDSKDLKDLRGGYARCDVPPNGGNPNARSFGSFETPQGPSKPQVRPFEGPALSSPQVLRRSFESQVRAHVPDAKEVAA